MAAGPEQLLHLLGRDGTPGLDPVEPGQARTDPATGRLALGGVVVGQASGAILGGVERRDLAGEVLVPRARGELVKRHRHLPQGQKWAASGHPDGRMEEVCEAWGMKVMPLEEDWRGSTVEYHAVQWGVRLERSGQLQRARHGVNW